MTDVGKSELVFIYVALYGSRLQWQCNIRMTGTALNIHVHTVIRG